MQKYIKNDLSEVLYFENDVRVNDWIDLDKYREMTTDEIKKHEAFRENEFCTFWNGEGWIDPRTDEEKQLHARENMKILTRYQLKRALVESGFKIDEVKAGIMENPDEMAREIALIALNDAEKFKRLDSAVLTIQKALSKNDAAMDDFWNYALSF